MSVVEVIRSAIRPVAVVLALVSFTGIAGAQQPSPGAVQTAKEIIKVTGATALFTPLIPGVMEQAKNLFLQQNPGLAKDLNEITVPDARGSRAAFRRADRRSGQDYMPSTSPKLSSRIFWHFTSRRLA